MLIDCIKWWKLLTISWPSKIPVQPYQSLICGHLTEISRSMDCAKGLSKALKVWRSLLQGRPVGVKNHDAADAADGDNNATIRTEGWKRMEGWKHFMEMLV